MKKRLMCLILSIVLVLGGSIAVIADPYYGIEPENIVIIPCEYEQYTP